MKRWRNGLRGNRRQVAFFSVLAIVVVGVAAAGLYSIFHVSSASAGGVARTATVARGTVQESVSASGNISPDTSDALSFGASGTVTSVKVTVGQTVKAGQLLATLDPAQAEANLQTAEATLASAQSTLAAAEQGGTTSQLDQNQVSISQAQSQLTTDQQTLSSDETTLAQAQQQLQNDEALGCPPASASSTGGGSNSTGSGNGGTSATGGGSGSGNTGSGSGNTGSRSAADPASATPPQSTTGSASSVMTTTAELNGTVDPDGAATNVWFEYGTSTNYGERTGTINAGSGTSSLQESASISGLRADTSYIFRLVAQSSHGTVYAAPQFLTTDESSCVVDQQDITTDQQTVQHQQATISDQEASISATEAGDQAQPATVQSDEAQVAQAKLTVNTDQEALAGTTLRAPISGTVTALNGSVGESVSGSSGGDTGASSAASASSTAAASTGSSSSGTGSGSSASSGFVDIENLHDLEVVAGFAEADATQIAVGQPASVTLSALPDTVVAGKVIAVSPTSAVVANVVTYNETVSLIDPPADVHDGMTALVAITVDTASDVLEVPSAAITTVGALSTVTVKSGNTTKTVTVTTGLVGNSTTQIDSGVQAGETLVEPTATVSSAGTSSSTPFGGGGGGRFLGGGGGGGLGGLGG
jgi:multidrug efflux pump subunit AcrA (membrane-fusion protein)